MDNCSVDNYRNTVVSMAYARRCEYCSLPAKKFKLWRIFWFFFADFSVYFSNFFVVIQNDAFVLFAKSLYLLEWKKVISLFFEFAKYAIAPIVSGQIKK